MTDGFMSSWRLPSRSELVAHKREETSSRVLPGVHFHGNVLLDARRALLFVRAGEPLGVLRGYRSSQPEDDVLFDALFPSPAAAAIRPGAVAVPLALSPGLRRPWREARIGGDASLLKLFGAVASPALLDEGRGVRLRLRVSLPRFLLTRYQPLQRGQCPAVAEVSLGIVLTGGDTVREGEHIGFLVRGEDGRNSVEPVLLSDSVGRRGIIGMWTLCERDVWAAAAVFAADSMVRRNAKISRRVSELSSRREVDFLVAQFHERVGGPPSFIPCTVVLPSSREAQNISYSAEISGQATDVALIQGSVVSGRFHDEGSPPASFLPEDDRGTEGIEESANRVDEDDETEEIGLQARDAEQTRPERGAPASPEPSSDDAAGGGDREKRGEGSSPVSQAQAQLEEIARQMRSLQAELGEIPPNLFDTEGGQTRDSATFAGPSSDAAAPLASASRQPVSSFGGESIRGLPRSAGPLDELPHGEALELVQGAEFDVSSESEYDCDGPSKGDGIGSRLDELARKYIGANYWSTLKLDQA